MKETLKFIGAVLCLPAFLLAGTILGVGLTIGRAKLKTRNQKLKKDPRP